MCTARIVVLAIALSAGGVAAYLASGSDTKPPPATTSSNTFIRRNERPDAVTQIAGSLELKPEQAETLARARQSGSLSLALRSIADVGLVENTTDEQAPEQGGSINVVRYGVQSSIATQK